MPKKYKSGMCVSPRASDAINAPAPSENRSDLNVPKQTALYCSAVRFF